MKIPLDNKWTILLGAKQFDDVPELIAAIKSAIDSSDFASFPDALKKEVEDTEQSISVDVSLEKSRITLKNTSSDAEFLGNDDEIHFFNAFLKKEPDTTKKKKGETVDWMESDEDSVTKEEVNEVNGVLVYGSPTVGKSTVMATLVKLGYKVLDSDNLSITNPELSGSDLLKAMLDSIGNYDFIFTNLYPSDPGIAKTYLKHLKYVFVRKHGSLWPHMEKRANEDKAMDNLLSDGIDEAIVSSWDDDIHSEWLTSLAGIDVNIVYLNDNEYMTSESLGLTDGSELRVPASVT